MTGVQTCALPISKFHEEKRINIGSQNGLQNEAKNSAQNSVRNDGTVGRDRRYLGKDYIESAV